MGTQLRERQTSRTTLDRGVAPSEGRPFWPFLMAALAVVVLVAAGLVFVLTDDSGPDRIQVSWTEGTNTRMREGGAYVVPAAPTIPGLHTGVREGGAYAAP
jgi:hypothetical protein